MFVHRKAPVILHTSFILALDGPSLLLGQLLNLPRARYPQVVSVIESLTEIGLSPDLKKVSCSN